MIKKYNSFILESNKYLDNLSDKELQDKMDYLRSEMNEIQEEISLVHMFQKERKEIRDKKFVSEFPESIFDLNKEQLKFVLEHHNGTGKFQYNKSLEYFSQLDGVSQCGYNSKTNQHLFTIRPNEIYNEDNTSRCEINTEIFEGSIKSIEFLGENLEKAEVMGTQLGVKILVRSSFDEKEKEIWYLSKGDVSLRSYTLRKFKSVRDMLSALVEEDWEQMCDADERGDKYN